jgi:NAD(P)-dependent dehydrogenase (short-subunit alcohol dehydrogenase family)
MKSLSTFGQDATAVIVGSTGGIGAALCAQVAAQENFAKVFGMSRSEQASTDSKVDTISFDLQNEATIAAAASKVAAESQPDLVIVATGILHDDNLQPEKSMRDIDGRNMLTNFQINTIGPTLLAKHFLPLMNRERKSVFAILSARVGSIGDNRLGGWVSYRASKAAINMSVATLAIEHGRRYPNGIVVALHPGTVETELSAPFRSRVPADGLFSTDKAASQLLQVIDGLDVDNSGGFFAWDGSAIPY